MVFAIVRNGNHLWEEEWSTQGISLLSEKGWPQCSWTSLAMLLCSHRQQLSAQALHTQLKCSKRAANVRALPSVCSSSSPALLWGLFVSCCWYWYPLTCRLKTVSAFTFVCSGDKILGKRNKASIQSKLKVKKIPASLPYWLGNTI